jgi:hypothetical protein
LVLGAAVLTGQASTASTVELVNRWEPGETVRTRLTIDNERTIGPLKTMGEEPAEQEKRNTRSREREEDCPPIMPIDYGTRSQKLVCEFDLTVKSVDADGVAEVEMVCRRVEAEADLSDSERFTFDSAKKAKARNGWTPREQTLADFVGKSIRLRVGRDGAIVEAEGLRGIVEAMVSLQDENALGAALLEQLGGANESGKDGFDEVFTAGARLLPGRPVRRGESWTTEVSHALPVAGRVRSEWESTLARVAKAGRSVLATITSTGRVRVSTPTGSGDGPPGLAAGIDLEFLPGKGEAETVFDVTRGRAVRAEMSLEMGVAVRIEQPGIGTAGGVMQEVRCRMVNEVVEGAGVRE